MNVLKTIVPGSAEPVSQASRQDRDSSSKRGGSGFSDTLGSLDKAAPPKPSASSQPEKADSADAPPADAVEPDVVDAPVSAAPTVSTTKTIVPTAIFLDATKVPPTEPATQTALPTQLEAPQNTKPVEVSVAGTTQLPASADNAVPLPVITDLAKLVTALSKPSSTTAAPTTADTVDGSEDTDDADIALPETSTENNDLLSLLASTVMPVDQPAQQKAAPASNDASSTLATVSGATTVGDPLADGAVTGSPVVRLQKQDAPALDLHFDTNEDGSTKVDITKASGDVSDVVQVVESRRFVGMAQTSNAAAITTAMATDPQWATAMAGQTTNSPMISSTGQVVHVLKIQMTPGDLGHVTAAMKLVGDELSVQLTAHTLKGYSELQKDSSTILDALKSHGFSVENVTVTLASGTDRQDSGTSNRQPADTGQQSAQQGQRGQEGKPQEQFYRRSGSNAREETISHDSVSQPEIPARVASVRPDHVYL